MLVSDTLSRSHLSRFEPEFTEDNLIHHVHFVLLNLPISETRLKQFQLETKNDPILQTLPTYTTHEWPEKHVILKDLLPYYTHRSDITFCEGILLKNERIIVPTTLRAEMKSLIHQGHLGIENCKKRARQSLFWPLMNSEIEDMIKRCPTCLTFRNRQPSEPIINHPIPNQAWEKIAADPFRLHGHYYLLMVDYHSKFIVIETLKNLQSSTVINKCKKTFSQFGTPKELVTDNGPEFSSHHFRSFSKTWDFEHRTSSPHFHQSNGLVERSIQTVKRTLKKAKLANEDHYLSILFLNSQPDENRLSPPHKLFNRPIRTNLPSAKPQPKPSTTNTAIEPQTQNRLSTLKPGDTVRIRTDEEKTWDKKGSVIAPNDRPRSYNVLNDKGNLIVRNPHHFIPTNKKFIVKHDYDNIIEPSETTSKKTFLQTKTDIPSNITTPPVRTKSGRINEKPKRYLEEC